MNDAGGPRARVLRLFSRLNIGGPSLHVILLSQGLRPLGYDTRLVIGRESPREGNMLALAAERDVACETMSGLGREIAPLSDLRALLGPGAADAGVAARDRAHAHRESRRAGAARRARRARADGRAHVPRPRAARLLLAAEGEALPGPRGVPGPRGRRARRGVGVGEARSGRAARGARAEDSRDPARPRARGARRDASARDAAPRGGDPGRRAARGHRRTPRADQGRAELPERGAARARAAARRALRRGGGRRGARGARAAERRRSASRAPSISSAGAATSRRSTATSTWSSTRP